MYRVVQLQASLVEVSLCARRRLHFGVHKVAETAPAASAAHYAYIGCTENSRLDAKQSIV